MVTLSLSIGSLSRFLGFNCADDVVATQEKETAAKLSNSSVGSRIVMRID